MAKLSPKDFSSITDWIKQYIDENMKPLPSLIAPYIELLNNNYEGFVYRIVNENEVEVNVEWEGRSEAIAAGGEIRLSYDWADDQQTYNKGYRFAADGYKKTDYVYLMVTRPAKTYTITVRDTYGGTIVSSATTAIAGAMYTITVTPSEGYKFTELTINGESIFEEGRTKYYRLMPAEDVVIAGGFEYEIYGTLSAPTCSVSVNDDTQLIYTISNSNAVDVTYKTGVVTEVISANSSIELTHMWDEGETSFLIDGYFSADHYNDSEVLSQSVDKPEPEYSISITQPENGTITCDKTTAKEGETITCTVTPDEGYQMDKFYVNGSESELSFVMPGNDITLSADISWILYGTLDAPTIEIVSNDTTQVIYSVKNSNTVDVLFNGETISAEGASEITHIWEASETQFLISGYFSAEHWINSAEVTETVSKPEKYSEGLAYKLSSDGTYYDCTGIGTCKDTEVNIPETYKGLPVTGISCGSLKAWTYVWGNATKITGKYIKYCRDYAFSFSNANSNGWSVDLPNCIEFTSSSVFQYTSYLTSVNLPKLEAVYGVSSVDYSTFRQNTMTELLLPSLKTIKGTNKFTLGRFYGNITKIDLGYIPSAYVLYSTTSDTKTLTDIYIHTTTEWTTKQDSKSSNYICYVNATPTIHLNKNLDLATAKTLFGEYFNYNSYKGKSMDVVFDIEE